MKYPERTKIVESLPFESRLGFIAFNVERCFKEAQRHPVAREQLGRLPLLTEGLEMLWARTERRVIPDPDRINTVIEHLATYETPAEDQENVNYHFDINLVELARLLRKGMRVLQDPERATPGYVASALDAPFLSVAQVYADYQNARNAELAVAEAALLRLQEWGNKPFSREVFEGIPEWTRGKLSKKYAEGRLTGSAEDDE